MITISKEVWSPLAQKIAKFTVKHAPQIAGYGGIGGFLLAIGLTYKNSADIHDGVEQKDYKKVVKKTIPIVAAAGASTIAIYYSCRESEKRLAAALLASNLLNVKNEELNNAIKDTVGEKKVKAIEEQVDKRKFENATANLDETLIENTPYGSQLCLELDTGRLFYSDVAYIRSQINKLGARYANNGRITLADFHLLLGLEDYDLDSHIGWDQYYLQDIDFDTFISIDSRIASNDEPIVTIKLRNHAVINDYYNDDQYIRL